MTALAAPAPLPAVRGSAPLVLGTAAHAVNDAYTAFLPALLPALQLRFDLDPAMLAMLVAAFAISASLPGPLLGRLADRIGARSVAALSVAFTAVLLSVLAVAAHPAVLFAVAASAGLGSAAMHPAGSMLVRQGKAGPELSVALFSAGGMLGYAAGPGLLAAARDMAGAALPLVLVLPGLLAAAALILLLPREGSPDPFATAPAPRFERKLIAGPVGLLTLAAAFAFLPSTAMLNGLPLLLVARNGLDPADPLLGQTISLFSLASGLGGIGIGLIALRLARRLLLGAVLLGSLPALMAVLVFEPGSAAFFTALGLAGALGYAATPLLVVSAQNLAPQSGATAAGMVFGLAAALTGLLYLGLGWLQAQLGGEAVLALAFLGPLIAAAIALPVLHRNRPASSLSLGTGALDALCACAAACGAGLVTPLSTCKQTCSRGVSDHD